MATENSTTLTRKCSLCKQRFPLDEIYFHKNKSDKTGLGYTCKTCGVLKSRQYYAENKEDALLNQKRRRDANPEKTRHARHEEYERNKATYEAYRRNKPEEQKERDRIWGRESHHHNRDARNAKSRIYYYTHKDSAAANNKRWAAEHPERAAEIKQSYIKRNPEKRKDPQTPMGVPKKGALLDNAAAQEKRAFPTLSPSNNGCLR